MQAERHEQQPLRPRPAAIGGQPGWKIEPEQHHGDRPAISQRLVIDNTDRLEPVAVSVEGEWVSLNLLSKAEQNKQHNPRQRIAQSNRNDKKPDEQADNRNRY